MFPRPQDISKAYGGGRTLQPGEALESEDDRAARARRVGEVRCSSSDVALPSSSTDAKSSTRSSGQTAH